MRSSMQSIFREHFAGFARSRSLHPRELRAAQCIRECYSAALGGRVLSCPQEHHSVVQYHACRHRSCPRCCARPRQQWLHAQLQQLLPCGHFHLVFTLPHVFIALWEFNRAWMNQLLFDCARQSLLALCAESRHLGAMPGLLMSLHTWGRTLSRHPHVHCLASAGGIDRAGQWHSARDGFLVPVRPLQILFRGKLLARLKHALDARQLHLAPHQDAQHWRSVIAQQYRKHWNIEISAPYAHGRGVALYLARYARGGPLPAERALHSSQGCVSFEYTDHRDQQRKTMHLSAHEFIARILWHAPPRAQHTVRRAGLYASAHRGHHQACCEHFSATTPIAMPAPPQALVCHQFEPPAAPRCPVCGAALVHSASLLATHRFGEFSISAPTPRAGCAASTGRSSGQTTAHHDCTLRRRFLRRRLPIN